MEKEKWKILIGRNNINSVYTTTIYNGTLYICMRFGREKNFLFPSGIELQPPNRIWGQTQPQVQWVTGAFFSGVKRQGREIDHSFHLVPSQKKKALTSGKN
jgi:hypothetical protein